MRKPIKYQLIRLTITAGGDFPFTAEADKVYKKITGVQLTISDTAALVDTTFKKFEIDNTEQFCDGFEAKMIVSGQDLSPGERWEDVYERADGCTIAGTYTDAGNAAAYPYNARIYLKLENPIE